MRKSKKYVSKVKNVICINCRSRVSFLFGNDCEGCLKVVEREVNQEIIAKFKEVA